jgi:hypothetical protein
MIHLIADDDKLTIVADDFTETSMAGLISYIRDYLNAAFGWNNIQPTSLP